MLTPDEIKAEFRRANPVPDEDRAPVSFEGTEALFSSIKARRGTMLDTKDKPLETAPSQTGWRHKPVVALTSFALIVAAVAVVTIFTGGGPTTDFVARPNPGTFVAYGPDEGIPTECYGTIGFGTGSAWYAGTCGLLELEADKWIHRADLPNPMFTVWDVEVIADGTVWIGGIDGGVLSYDGDTVTEHELVAPYLAVTSDGTVWAGEYLIGSGQKDEQPALRSYDGQTWATHPDAGRSDHVAVGPDDTVWVSGMDGLRSYNGTNWDGVDVATSVDLSIEDVAADGVVWGFAVFGEKIASYDGTWAVVDVPTLTSLGITPLNDGEEIIDDLQVMRLAVEADGTIWLVSHVYGALSYDGSSWTRFTTEDGLISERLFFVEVGPDNSVWLVSEGEGLTRYYP